MEPWKGKGCNPKTAHSIASDGCPCAEFRRLMRAAGKRAKAIIAAKPAARSRLKALMNAARNKLGTDQRREKGRFA